MRLTRTVRKRVRDVEHMTGVEVRLLWIFYSGLYLEDSETGAQYALGRMSSDHLLTPEEQESICRGLHREHWIVLLGLDPSADEDD